MRNFAYTPEQSAAIEVRGRTIVSASAGSGKTFVMIEKLVSLILREADIPDILAVTFTKKAASQMKDKLRAALIERINDPTLGEDARAGLKRKLALLPQADISTIHAFCTRLIRRYFYLVDLPSDFEVLADESEAQTLRRRALDKLFEEAYSAGEADFYELLSVYRKRRSDDGLRNLIVDFYAKARPNADYRETLEGARYDEESFSAVSEELADRLRAKLARREARLCALSDALIDMPRAEAFHRELLVRTREACAEKDYYALRAVLSAPLPSKPRATQKTSAAEADVLEALGKIKRELTDLAKAEKQTEAREVELERYLSAGRIARELIRYTLRFDDIYAEEKRSRGKLDYNDLEHFTLRLLRFPAVRAELREKYRFVFVDEYQDVNPVQEAILSAVSGEEVFLVGDMKQSIYGFRGSKSLYFADKVEAFGREGHALYLKHNFRSADAILSFVNAIFSVAMKAETGVDYAATSMMTGSGRYPEGAGRVRLHAIPPEAKEKISARGVYSVEANDKRTEREPSNFAKALLRIIRTETESRFYDLEKKEYRKAGYGDIAVLVRKHSAELEEAVRYLSACGVPVSFSGNVNLCDYPEVATLLDWLSYLDNAEQDIPLCGALLSPAGGLDEDDLAAIRLRFPKDTFRGACRRYLGVGDAISEKLKAFFDYAETLRALAQAESAGEVLAKLIAERHLETELLAFPNGRQRVRRVERLIAEAKDNVRDFLARLATNGRRIDYAEPAGENAVQILTVHAAKGLEYPIVIVTDLCRVFHGADTDEALFSEGLPAPRCYDKEHKIRSETLLRRLAQARQKEETVKDEMNLFYVALTRAKFSLHLLLTERREFCEDMTAEARCWADFFSADRFGVEEAGAETPPFEERSALESGKPGDEAPFLAAMDAIYPYAASVDLPVKSSASAILAEDEEYYDLPSIYGESSAEKGTIYHKFLELADFDAPVEAEYERLLPRFSEEERKELDLSRLREILAMPIFREVRGMRLLREQKFLCYLPASSGPESESEEEVLFQGAIDLLALGDGCAHIVDYKYASKPDAAVLAHYASQLRLYRKAVSKIRNIPERNIRMTIVNLLACRELTVFDN